MSAAASTLEKQILALPPTARVRIAERVLESVDDFTDPAVARAWEAEIERRVADVRAGKVRPIPAEKVFARVRRQLHEVRRLSSPRGR